MVKFRSIKKDFMDEARRILYAADEKKVILRLLGAIAFRMHCPKFCYIQEKLGRALSDIDFVAYSKQSSDVRKLFLDLGYTERGMINMLLGGRRFIFYDLINNRHCDIFFDRLEFNHIIDFRGRLKIDYPTIPLVDLLLEKMQIVQVNEKDLIDVIMLLREHDVGSGDAETINADYLAKLCARDWGLWKTVTINLQKIKTFLTIYKAFENSDREDLADKVDVLLRKIEAEPKTLEWKLRNKIGERKKWYREVEELYEEKRMT